MSPPAPRLHRFPGGLELLCVPNRSAPVLALDLWVRAGSADERPGEEGLAHLVEHMLFKGTARRGPGAAAREVEGLGGQLNACTGPDHTVYSLVLASRYAEVGLDLLADAVLHSRFDPGELEREKGVVLEELHQARDLPEDAVSELLLSLCFRVHPYGRPVLGQAESVAAFSRSQCLGFLERWYQPGSLTLVAAGDADPAWLVEEVGRLFRWERSRPPPRRKWRREPRRGGYRGHFEARAVTETYFELAFPGPRARHPDVAAFDLLMAVLVHGEASRLQHRVKLDRNLVRGVSGGAWTPEDPGLLTVGGVVDPGRLEAALGAIGEELFRLHREPVGARELERARENLEADLVYQKETVEGQAGKAGFFHVVLGDVAAEHRYVEALRRVSPVDLTAVARTHLRASRAALVALHPRGAHPAFGAAEAGESLARTEAAAAARGRRTRRPRPGLVRRVLSCGARVLVKVNPATPTVGLHAACLGGLRLEPARLAGAYHLLAGTLVRGTPSRTASDIAHQTDELGGGLEGFSGRNAYGLRAEFLSKYLEDGLDLFADVLCHPTFPAEEVEKERDDAQAALERRRDDPAGYAFRLLERALYGSHPYGRDVLGTPEGLRRVGSREVARLHAALDPRHLAVAAAGDVDPDLVCDFFARALDVLGPGQAPALPPSPEPPGRPRVRKERSPIGQTHLAVGFLGTHLAGADRHAVEVLAAALAGQGGRLFRRLREELGLAYAVSCACVEGLDPGYLAGYVATSPDRAAEARLALLDEFARMAAGGLAPGELEEAQRKLVGSFELALQENAAQAAQLALDELYGLGGRGFQAYGRAVFAVTEAEVAAAARRYLRREAYVCVTLGPGSADRG